MAPLDDLVQLLWLVGDFWLVCKDTGGAEFSANLSAQADRGRGGLGANVPDNIARRRRQFRLSAVCAFAVMPDLVAGDCCCGQARSTSPSPRPAVNPLSRHHSWPEPPFPP